MGILEMKSIKEKNIRVIFIVLTIIFGVLVIYYFPFNFNFSSISKITWSLIPITVCFHFFNLFIGPLGIVKNEKFITIKNKIARNLYIGYFTIGFAIIPILFSITVIILVLMFIIDIKNVEEVSSIQYFRMISLACYSLIALFHLIYLKKLMDKRKM